MALKITRPQGTEDITPENISKWYTVEQVARDTAKCFGFHEMRIPTFESTDSAPAVCRRNHRRGTEGNVHGQRQKETEFTLRPEGTSGTIRSMLQNGMLNAALPQKGILHSLLFPPRTAASRQTERIPPVRRGNGRQCRRCRRCGNHQSGKVRF